MELKFAAAARPEKASADVQRRQKLVRRIDQQIGFVREMVAGKQPRAAWAWMDEAGTYFLPIKYGRQQIELEKGDVLSRMLRPRLRRTCALCDPGSGVEWRLRRSVD